MNTKQRAHKTDKSFFMTNLLSCLMDKGFLNPDSLHTPACLFIWMEDGTTVKYLVKIQNESSIHQIMLHVKFMEINKNALKEWGTDFLIKNRQIGSEIFDVGSFAGKVTGPSDPLTLGNAVDFFFNIPSREVSAMIQALHENNLLSILAAPNLSAMSGEEASFLAGGEFPIPIVSGSMGTQTVTIQYKEFGIKLRFIPTVMDSNLVNIKVATEVSSLDFENGIELSGFRVPSLMSRKTETTVELKEGEYLIIGGLLSNEVSQLKSKIPILGDIPVLGALFSSRRYLNKESELLITLTPRIIQSIQENNVPELHLPEM